MQTDFNAKWNACLDIIRDVIGQQKFDTWFSCAEAVSFENNALTVAIPSEFYKEVYCNTFGNAISSTLHRVFGPDVQLFFSWNVVGHDEASRVSVPAPRQSRILMNKTARAMEMPADPQLDPVKYASVDSHLNPIYTFENYCVGESNRLPYTIAKYIAENPNRMEFNPFFLYGDVGVGKTHLAQATAISIKEQNPQKRVYYTTMRHFTNQLAVAHIEHTIPKFIKWYQGIDVLVIDDLQELTSTMKSTMEVLFPIFNHLHQSNKHLLFTCDRPPVDLDGITDRLIDRFKWGITEKLEGPDLELRKKILRFKASKGGIVLNDEIVDYIAENATGSVRAMEGIVMGLLTRSIQMNIPVSLGMVKDVMRSFVKAERKKAINFDMIVETTAEICNLNPDAIFSVSRVRDITDARQIIMYLARKLIGLSTPAIGSRLNRSHTTVMHGIAALEDRMSVSKDTASLVAQIEERVKA